MPAILVFVEAAPFYILTNHAQKFQLFHIIANTFFITVILVDVKWYFIVVLIFISLRISTLNTFSYYYWLFLYLL